MKVALIFALVLTALPAHARPLEPVYPHRLMLIHRVPLRGMHLAPQAAQAVTASWYGQHYAGRPTASGAIFDPTQMTAAHRTLKLGTRVRVTNPENGTSVVVTINDRGPFAKGRDLDLSEGAAKLLGFRDKGVARLLIEIL
ncbi:MAG: septal ring lytic transglycosylase RlpA family protein [Terracidiphilus sp.]